ncbi:ComEA family DNA-binding protein [Porticoccus sp.]|uniref:ComEA family DNA-binding protein n=1 Tax=Porticoccus sp. TaxID=2024853 RepID=UPI003F6A51F8
MQSPVMININTATADELSRMLKGIGEKRAEAIVAYREENGPFRTVEQLQSVKGVGEMLLEQNRDMLSVK